MKLSKRYLRRIKPLRDELWRLVVDLDLGAEGRRNIGIAAANDGEGASTLACALALASAELTRQRTVLIDADTHSAGLTKGADLARKEGLTDWTVSTALPVYQVKTMPEVEIVPVGKMSRSIAEVIAAAQTRTHRSSSAIHRKPTCPSAPALQPLGGASGAGGAPCRSSAAAGGRRLRKGMMGRGRTVLLRPIEPAPNTGRRQ